MLRTIRYAALALVLAACANQTNYDPSYKGAQRIKTADVKFDDGDTFAWKNERIRILGIDTPETPHPEHGQDEGQPFGEAAAESTRVWMTRAELLELVIDGRDKYRRRLAHVFVDRELLAVRLLNHGLAYETVSHFGDNGFPDLAQMILDTSREAPKPQFEEPYKWKQKQRKKREAKASQ